MAAILDSLGFTFLIDRMTEVPTPDIYRAHWPAPGSFRSLGRAKVRAWVRGCGCMWLNMASMHHGN